MKEFVLGTIICIGILCGIINFGKLIESKGESIAIEKFQAEAVNFGHAQYYLDENNDRQWRWLPIGDQKNEKVEK